MNRTVTGGRRQRHSAIAILIACVFLVESCKSEKGPAPVVRLDPILPVQTAVASPAPAAPAAPAAQAAVTQSSWTPDALEELLAPIALYPDQLLGQILAASINSQEVLDAGNWLIQNENLKGNDLTTAAQKAGFGPAMLALVQYPTVVDMMCQQMDWTKQVGSAFNSDQKSVLDAVQRLRKEAANVGNLKSGPQQTVATKTEGGNTYIEVKPADPKIVYVPQYDPQVVYTTPPPPGTTTTTTTTGPSGKTTTTSTTTSPTTSTTETKKEKDGVSTEAAVAIGLIGFAAGIAVGAAVNDDYYYPAWGYGGVYYGPRPFYPPAYVYRPVYGPAFRPAYGYASPPGYRNNYNNVRNNNVNININNNNNYYNRFNDNQNLRNNGNNGNRSPIANSPNRATQQPRVGNSAAGGAAGAAGGAAGNWRGQSTYAGARNGNTTAATRPSAGTQPANRPTTGAANTGQRVDRGYDNAARPAATDRSASTGAASRPTAQPSTGAASRPTAQPSTGAASRPTPQATTREAPARDSAFSSAKTQNSGNFERAASARGNASVGSRPAGGGARRR